MRNRSVFRLPGRYSPPRQNWLTGLSHMSIALKSMSGRLAPFSRPVLRRRMWKHHGRLLFSARTVSFTHLTESRTLSWRLGSAEAPGIFQRFQAWLVLLCSNSTATQCQQDTFTGKLMHSLQYKSASEHKSKKVFIIGSATSAHDIAAEHSNNGIGISAIFESLSWL